MKQIIINFTAARLMHKYNAHGATDVTGFGLLGHAQNLAKHQKNEVSFVIHNLPVIAKMAAVAKACGNMFQLLQGHSAETSGGLLICLPREQVRFKRRFGVHTTFFAFITSRSSNIFSQISLGCGVLQGYREAGGLSGVDNRYRRKGQ